MFIDWSYELGVNKMEEQRGLHAKKASAQYFSKKHPL